MRLALVQFPEASTGTSMMLKNQRPESRSYRTFGSDVKTLSPAAGELITELKKTSGWTLSTPSAVPALVKVLSRPLTKRTNCEGPAAPSVSGANCIPGGNVPVSAGPVTVSKLVVTVCGASGTTSVSELVATVCGAEGEEGVAASAEEGFGGHCASGSAPG